jgi:polysaccharide export outer membrane protein
MKRVGSVRDGIARRMLLVAAIALGMALAGCGLPRTGPTKSELFSGTGPELGDALLVPVTEAVVAVTQRPSPLGFGSSFRDAGAIGADEIRPGDVLGLTVFENIDQGLLAGGTQGATPLREIQVDGTGHIFVPYAGRVLAAGNTPEQLRQIITSKLDLQTPDPQIQVTRIAGDGATVSILGMVGAPGVYPIERPTRTLSGMLARAGGVAASQEVALISVTRSGRRGTIWLEDLYDHPSNDIALRPGDRIVVEQDRRAFTALGATGAQTRVPFDRAELSAMEAIALAGGLNATLADPTGVFILRDETPEVARLLLNDPSITTERKVVYVLNFTEPNGIFLARDFTIRDDDTVYITEAPFSQFNKALAAVSLPVNTAGSIRTLAR